MTCREGRLSGGRGATVAGHTDAYDVWAEGAAYDAYVGRWSRVVAREFVRWLEAPGQGSWLDVGCGTGTLVGAIVERAEPRRVLGVDRSRGFVGYARRRIGGDGVAFTVADAQALPVPAGEFDAAVSGLVLNFVPDPASMIREMARATRPGGTVAVYVWDYARGLEFVRVFWDAVRAVAPESAALDEGARFPICAPGPLEAVLAGAGLSGIETRPLDVSTHFRDFDDYWSPFLGGQGPAPAYAMALPEARRAALREKARAMLPIAADGTIRLTARAWAARGAKP